jgi:hypothetical protein
VPNDDCVEIQRNFIERREVGEEEEKHLYLSPSLSSRLPVSL